MHWPQLVWVAIGGALGAVSRYALSTWVNTRTDSGFPFGTFTVNLLGSFLFGLLFIAVFSTVTPRESLRLLVLVGFLGAFTTFSTFSFETMRLVQEGQLGVALMNVLASVCLCLVGVWSGFWIGKNLL
mgnify:CR=1 FL=1